MSRGRGQPLRRSDSEEDLNKFNQWLDKDPEEEIPDFLRESHHSNHPTTRRGMVDEHFPTRGRGRGVIGGRGAVGGGGGGIGRGRGIRQNESGGIGGGGGGREIGQRGCSSGSDRTIGGGGVGGSPGRSRDLERSGSGSDRSGGAPGQQNGSGSNQSGGRAPLPTATASGGTGRANTLFGNHPMARARVAAAVNNNSNSRVVNDPRFQRSLMAQHLQSSWDRALTSRPQQVSMTDPEFYSNVKTAGDPSEGCNHLVIHTTCYHLPERVMGVCARCYMIFCDDTCLKMGISDGHGRVGLASHDYLTGPFGRRGDHPTE